MNTIKDKVLLTLYLLNQDKEIQQFGKTIVQKILYFVLEAEEVKENYSPYHYGPFSRLIQDTVDNLIYSNALKVKYEFDDLTNTVYPKKLEIQSEELKKYVHNLAVQNENSFLIQKIQKTINFYNEKQLNQNKFSIIAKIDLLKKELENSFKNVNDELILKRAKDYNWQINKTQLTNNLQYLNELKAII